MANVAELCKSLSFKCISLVIVKFQHYYFKSNLETYFLKGIVIIVAQGEYKLCSSESRDSDFKCHCWFNTFHNIILFLIDTKWLKNWRLPWIGHSMWDKNSCGSFWEAGILIWKLLQESGTNVSFMQCTWFLEKPKFKKLKYLDSPQLRPLSSSQRHSTPLSNISELERSLIAL